GTEVSFSAKLPIFLYVKDTIDACRGRRRRPGIAHRSGGVSEFARLYRPRLRERRVILHGMAAFSFSFAAARRGLAWNKRAGNSPASTLATCRRQPPRNRDAD